MYFTVKLKKSSYVIEVKNVPDESKDELLETGEGRGYHLSEILLAINENTQKINKLDELDDESILLTIDYGILSNE